MSSLVEQLAERELFSFVSAVSRLYGKEEANVSASDWIELLAESQTDGLDAHDFRKITIAAACLLADRVRTESRRVGT